MAQAKSKKAPPSALTMDQFDINNVRLTSEKGKSSTQQYGHAIKLSYVHDPAKPNVLAPLIFHVADVNTTGVKTFYDEKVKKTTGVTISIRLEPDDDVYKQFDDIATKLTDLLTEKCVELGCLSQRVKKGEANRVDLEALLKAPKPKDGQSIGDVRYVSLKLPYFGDSTTTPISNSSFKCAIYFTNDFEVQKFRELDANGNSKNKRKIVYKKQPLVQLGSEGRMESLITTPCVAEALGFRIAGFWVDRKNLVTWRIYLEYSHCMPVESTAATSGTFVESDSDDEVDDY